MSARREERARRRRISWVIGIAGGLVATFAVYLLMFAGVIGELRRASETSRMYVILGFVGLVVGSSIAALAYRAFDRRAKRIDEEARIPKASVRKSR